MVDPDGSDEEDTDDSDVEDVTVDGLVAEESDTHTGSLNEEMWETDIVGNGGTQTYMSATDISWIMKHFYMAKFHV